MSFDEGFARVGPAHRAGARPDARKAGETELAELLWTIAVINAWNRLGATAQPWPYMTGALT